jgi:hypothetical protein
VPLVIILVLIVALPNLQVVLARPASNTSYSRSLAIPRSQDNSVFIPQSIVSGSSQAFQAVTILLLNDSGIFTRPNISSSVRNLSSLVISVDIEGVHFGATLAKPISLTFAIQPANGTYECVYWHIQTFAWDTAGNTFFLSSESLNLPTLRIDSDI